MNKALLSELIRRNRKAKGLTQAQFAELLNMSEMTIRRWESGDRSPRMEELQKISEVLDVPVEKLLDNDTSNNDNNISLPPTNEHSHNQGMAIFTSKNGERFEVPATPEGYAFLRDIVMRSMSAPVMG